MFWENLAQAEQRLTNSIVMYGEDPVRFGRIGDVNTNVRNLRTGKDVPVSLEDKAFDEFRRLPPLGFVNHIGSLVFLQRQPRRTQSHGLTNENVRAVAWDSAAGGFSQSWRLSDVVADAREGFIDLVDDSFPSFSAAVDLVEKTQPIAFSGKYAITVDPTDLRRLYRMRTPIGVVASDGSVLLTKQTMCYREELSAIIPDARVMEI